MTSLPAWTAGVHHDGSALYVSNPLPTLNETVTLRLRMPQAASATRVFLRSEPDGEQTFTEMTPLREDAVSVWLACDITMRNPRMPYRFKLMTADGAFYLNALGISRADGPDFYDFKLIADFQSPSWLDDAVFYQIFPDRFYNGDAATDVPEGRVVAETLRDFETQMRPWGAEPLTYEQAGSADFYGGDLAGIAQKIDYLTDLGVTALYLNPIFTSPSNHRYNTSDFYEVDPYLGGDAALTALNAALKGANMRYVLDLTTNHCGDQNQWFKDAQADSSASSAAYFTFYEHPKHYEAWLGISTLPCFNYGRDAVHGMMYRDDDAIMRYWLRAPFEADGWRLDVWNMTARQGDGEHQLEAGQGMRAAVKAENPDAYLFGETFFDGSASLQGDALDAVMNYQGFAFPLWRWLAGHDIGAWMNPPRPYHDPVLMPAEAAAEQMQRMIASIPWAVARIQFNLLGSHDTPRILSVVDGDKSLAKLAAVLLMTYPGVPSIYYGDEIGLEGWRDPDNRRTMPWDEGAWDQDLRTHYQTLVTLRRESDALRAGGMQFLYAEGGVLAYQRESETQRAIVVAYRGPEPLESASIPVRNGGVADGLVFQDALSGDKVISETGTFILNALETGFVRVLIQDK